MLVVGFQFTGLSKAVHSFENGFYKNCNSELVAGKMNWFGLKKDPDLRCNFIR